MSSLRMLVVKAQQPLRPYPGFFSFDSKLPLSVLLMVSFLNPQYHVSSHRGFWWGDSKIKLYRSHPIINFFCLRQIFGSKDSPDVNDENDDLDDDMLAKALALSLKTQKDPLRLDFQSMRCSSVFQERKCVSPTRFMMRSPRLICI